MPNLVMIYPEVKAKFEPETRGNCEDEVEDKGQIHFLTDIYVSIKFG